MSEPCPVCYGKTTDSLLCVTCTSALTTDLRGNAVVMGVAELVDNLHVAQAKLAKLTEQPSGKGSVKHERLPIDIGAMEAVRNLESFLSSWARDVTGEAWWPTKGRYVAVEAADALLNEIDTIRRHGAVKELVEEITKAIDQGRYAIDPTIDFTRFRVGPCPEDNCPRTVFALCPAEDSPRPALMACYLMAQTENRPDLGAGFAHSWASNQFFRTGKRIKDKMDAQARQARIDVAVFGEGAA